MVVKVDKAIPPLLSSTEIAKLLDVSRNAVNKMINAGKLPARRVGSVWVVRESVASRLEVNGGRLALRPAVSPIERERLTRTGDSASSTRR